ncbi:tripartite tricarboxylate transporter substrate-binding protein [Bordetella trematum]|uniref:tripartite tricarboxylate transporter substrate-binding protein n=1 Tax=Bordetella trematum TaxID=123899 RepID=UPI003AF3DC6F
MRACCRGSPRPTSAPAICAIWSCSPPSAPRQFPDVPTLRELGVDSVIDSPYGIAGPKDLPAQQVQIIHDAFRQALASPAGKRVLEQLNQPESYRSPAETDRLCHPGLCARERPDGAIQGYAPMTQRPGLP